MSPFTNKTLMITGGTGSFGNAVLNRFLNTDIGEIRIFSRDEKKQDDMRHEFQAKMPEAAEKISFYIGDVRDLHGCPPAPKAGASASSATSASCQTRASYYTTVRRHLSIPFRLQRQPGCRCSPESP